MQLVSETELDSTLICSSSVLQPKGHGFVCICSEWSDEGCLDLMLFLEGYLMIARVAVEEG